MKFIIELNTKDIINAKEGRLLQMVTALQAIAQDSTTEPEVPVAPLKEEPAVLTEAKEPAAKPKTESKKKHSRKKETPAAQAVATNHEEPEEPVTKPKTVQPEPEAPITASKQDKTADETAPTTEEAVPEPETTLPGPRTVSEKPKEPIDREAIKAELKAMAKAGKAAALNKLVHDHGATRLSEIPDEELPAFLEEAKAL